MNTSAKIADEAVAALHTNAKFGNLGSSAIMRVS